MPKGTLAYYPFLAADLEKRLDGFSSPTPANRFGNSISPYILSEGELADRDKNNILDEIRKKHVVVCGNLLE